VAAKMCSAAHEEVVLYESYKSRAGSALEPNFKQTLACLLSLESYSTLKVDAAGNLYLIGSFKSF